MLVEMGKKGRDLEHITLLIILIYLFEKQMRQTSSSH